MRAIGELSNVAGAHLTSRSSRLDFVNYVPAADDMDLAVRTRIDTAAAAPSQKKGLRPPIPDEFRVRGLQTSQRTPRSPLACLRFMVEMRSKF